MQKEIERLEQEPFPRGSVQELLLFASQLCPARPERAAQRCLCVLPEDWPRAISDCCPVGELGGQCLLEVMQLCRREASIKEFPDVKHGAQLVQGEGARAKRAVGDRRAVGAAGKELVAQTAAVSSRAQEIEVEVARR